MNSRNAVPMAIRSTAHMALRYGRCATLGGAVFITICQYGNVIDSADADAPE